MSDEQGRPRRADVAADDAGDSAVTDDGRAADTHWPDYYAVTAERPSWATTRMAADAFGPQPAEGPRFAVDLGCGAGRDTRELLRRGWRVLATDMTPEGPETLWRLTPSEDRDRLETVVSTLDEFEIPVCDLLNANLILPFQVATGYEATWQRILAAIPIGGRFSGMLFGDRDQSAGEEGMTCPRPEVIRAYLDGFELEHWDEREEDTQTALGEDHHFHLVEVVAVRRSFPSTGYIG